MGHAAAVGKKAKKHGLFVKTAWPKDLYYYTFAQYSFYPTLDGAKRDADTMGGGSTDPGPAATDVKAPLSFRGPVKPQRWLRLTGPGCNESRVGNQRTSRTESRSIEVGSRQKSHRQGKGVPNATGSKRIDRILVWGLERRDIMKKVKLKTGARAKEQNSHRWSHAMSK